MGLEQNNEQHYREVVDKYIDPTVSVVMTTRDYVVRPTVGAYAITIILPPVDGAKGRTYSILARGASFALPITITDKNDSEGWVDLIIVQESENVIVYSDGAKWVTLPAVVSNAYGTMRLGCFATGGVATNAVPITASLNAFADGQLDVLSVFGASIAALGSGYSAKCGRFRHIAYNDRFDQETYGLVGQMVARAATMVHLHAGLMGTFEGHTSGVVLSSTYAAGHAGVIARIGGHAAITATTPLCGFLAFNNQSGAIVGGSTIAYKVVTVNTVYPWAYGFSIADGHANIGLYMNVTAQGISSTVTALGAAVIGHAFYVTVAAPNNQSGMSAYFDATITGTTAGHSYGLGSWINATGAAVLSAGHIIVPFEGGVYTDGAQATARIVFAGQHQAILGGVPASLHAWRLNTNRTITAVIAAANPGSVGYVAGAGTAGIQVGYIPIADIVGPGIVYVRVYSSAT